MEQRLKITQQEISDMRMELEQGQSEGEKKPVRAFRMVLAVAYTIIILCLAWILLSIINARVNGLPPNIFGYYFLTVESSSMEPTLMVGDTIVAKQIGDSESLEIGDIVAFKDGQNRVVAHRIVSSTTTQQGDIAYITKGDNPINGNDVGVLLQKDIYGVYALTLPF